MQVITIIDNFGETYKTMALTVGIIGLPQSGKTSLFNAITKSNAPVAGYSTGSAQANIAMVNVPDDRVDRLTDMFQPKKKTYTTVEFVDVAGLRSAEDSAKPEGLNAEFIGHIRNANALAIVVRCFVNPSSAQASQPIRAAGDIADLLLTLALTDIDTLTHRLERTVKSAKAGADKYQTELDLLRRVIQELENGALASDLSYTAAEKAIIDDLFLLTMKPRFYVANIAEDALYAASSVLQQAMETGVAPQTNSPETQAAAEIGLRARTEKASAVAASARLEAELNELSPEDAAEYLEALNLPQLGAGRVIQAGYRSLQLVTFLTAGEDEVRAWTVREDSRAPVAAGKIHSDIEKGFIRAEVVAFDDLISCGSLAAAREKGLLRLEGKEYIIKDGDIAHFRFNVTR